MKRYEILHINFWAGLEITCTDTTVIEWIISEWRKEIPSLKAERMLSPFHWNIKNLRDRDTEVLEWVVAQLCHKGWEPIGVASAGDRVQPTGYTLRYCREDAAV